VADQKTNVEKLEEAGVLDSTGMDPEHIRILNEEFTEEELQVLHRLSKKIVKRPLRPGPDASAL
jgi:hypothetical protein